jgi:hypothetical protein
MSKMKPGFDAHILHVKSVFVEHEHFYPRLQDEIEWKPIQWRSRPFPRLCCHSVQMFPVGRTIVEWLETFCRQNLGVKASIRDVFGNYYRTGTDFLPHHRDNYTDGETKLHVISISFGASRRFSFKQNDRVAQSMMLDAGDVIIFDPYMNEHYTHGIAKTPSLTEGRINLTCFATFDIPPYGKPVEGAISSTSNLLALKLIENDV